MATLVSSSLRPSSLPTYKRAWALFNHFTHSIFHQASIALPVTPPVLALFIAYLFDHHYAPSTVSTYISALGYTHKLSDLPDPTKSFFIIQMMKGYHKKGICLDSRLPITLPILHWVIGASQQFSCSAYYKSQFCAMSAFAFYAFFRIGEMTAPRMGSSPPLQLNQLG